MFRNILTNPSPYDWNWGKYHVRDGYMEIYGFSFDWANRDDGHFVHHFNFSEGAD